MKSILTVFLTFCCVILSFSQRDEGVINNIKDQIEIIDSYMESDVFSLDPEEFLDEMADHSAELNGYYEHDRLKKIIKNIGTPEAMVITIFYFWNDQLIHVNYKQRKYMEKKNDLNQVVMDYSNAFTRFESKLYFHKGKQIDKTFVGNAIKKIEIEENFVKYSLRMKALLDNKFENRNTYKTLQGKWVNVQFPEEHMIFEETIRFNFREGKFLKRLKVKIKDAIMYCSSPKDEYIFKYKIKSLDEEELLLEDMQDNSSNLVLYKKVE
ncbi:hypothetical protein [Aquimarina sp. RZ0]|uniref:hypothetical protein n=1 Tax=Aquimarina sp. RZ0 TaxID=2607730 RepID=UPI0011F37701|nr:hypothetical protein [Aquimarina sp. RZ0]KAA1243159.1 hypothetical protein F0000_22335 [Aquimarina sp. RZ0]